MVRVTEEGVRAVFGGFVDRVNFGDRKESPLVASVRLFSLALVAALFLLVMLATIHDDDEDDGALGGSSEY